MTKIFMCIIIICYPILSVYLVLVYMHVFTGASAIGVNPKINNMLVGFNAAKYDILWISDSSVMGE